MSIAKISFLTLLTSAAKSLGEESTNAFYTRYNAYPKYCSTPDEMSSRAIPPLTTTEKNTQLIQVQAVIRHGARTPWHAGDECWENYATTTQWNCELQTIMAPPLQSTTSSTGKEGLIFAKKYDALQHPLKNELNGTCQLGQLLEQGYEQEVTNGKILRKAYLSKRHKHMFLFHDINENATYFDEPYTYHRADDEQRTLMSGQVLLRSLFSEQMKQKEGDVVINLHTADRSMDILSPNEDICPKLTKLKEESWSSSEFIQRNTSTDAMELRRVLREELKSAPPIGLPGWEALDSMLDCLMTTICTDKVLPDPVNDFIDDYGDSLFMQLIRFTTWKWMFKFLYNEAEFSKLAMGPLWADIVERAQLTSSLNDTSTFPKDMPRLVLYSGHDNTILPLLASLMHQTMKDWLWLPYASMFIIEIYAILEESSSAVTSRAFRLLYNGKVITDSIQGCPSEEELCDLQILLDFVAPFATRDRDCMTDTKTTTTATTTSSTKFHKIPSSSPLLPITIALISCFVSGMATFFYLRKYRVLRKKTQSNSERKLSLPKITSSSAPTRRENGTLYGAANLQQDENEII